MDKSEDTNIEDALRSTILDPKGRILKYSEVANAAANESLPALNDDSNAFISREDANALTYKTQIALSAAHQRGIRMVCFNSQHNLGMERHKQHFMLSLVKPTSVNDT